MNNGLDPSRGVDVHVIDDDPGTRHILGRVVRDMGLDIHTHKSAESFISQAPDLSREGVLLILDLNLPGMGGLELLERMRATAHSPTVICITGTDDLERILDTLRAGAMDCLVKPLEFGRIRDLILRGIRREQRRLEHEDFASETECRLARLSRGEMDVVECLLEGRLNKQIAAFLHISARTVEARRSRIMKKMEVDSLPVLVTRIVIHRERMKAIGTVCVDPASQDEIAILLPTLDPHRPLSGTGAR